MRLLTFIALLFALLGGLTLAPNAMAAETSVLKGRVLDVDGKPVEGAEIFIYDSTNTRRPADFISQKTGKDGRTQIVLPTGNYWAVARVKKDERYGPLMLGDRHSGEPTELELTPGKESENDFVVADIRDVGRKKQTVRDNVLKLKGRVLDKQGIPVPNAYVFAHKHKEVEQLPDYLSAWTDDDGNYTLYLPAGEKYFMGVAREFPPKSKLSVSREFIPENGKLDVAMDIELTVQ